jgi:hypothetical protein
MTALFECFKVILHWYCCNMIILFL